jgi:hypothetical protein
MSWGGVFRAKPFRLYARAQPPFILSAGSGAAAVLAATPTAVCTVTAALTAPGALASGLGKAGQFTLNTGTGNQAITGLGFTPKAVIFWTNAIVPVSSVNEVRYCFGVATSSTQRWCMHSSYNGGTNGFADHQFMSTRCLNNRDATTDTVQYQADFVSMDSDGFTINVTTGQAVVVNYLAIGGSGVSAKAGTFDQPTGTGNFATTGVGFAPKAVLFGVGPLTNNELLTGNGSQTLGMASGTSNFGCASVNIFTTPSQANSFINSTRRLIAPINQSGAEDSKSTLVSFDADGWTNNFVQGVPTTTRVGYLALGGSVSYDVSILARPTSTGSQSKTGLSFKPSSLLMVCPGHASSTTAATVIKWGLGATDGTNQVATGWYDPNASTATTTPIVTNKTTKALLNPGTTSGSVLAEAGITSFNTDGYTLNWTTVDGVAAEYMVLAIGGGGGLSAALAATPSAVTALTAAMTTGIVLASAPQSVCSVTAALTTGAGVWGSNPQAVCTVSATLFANPLMRATPTGNSTLTGNLSTGIRMNAAPKGVCTVNADLTIVPAGYRSSPKTVSSVVADLSTGINLASAFSANTTLTAALTTNTSIQASPQSICTLTATLTAPSDVVSLLPYSTWLQSDTAMRCVLVETTAVVNGTPTPRYLSSRDYTTNQFDTPANVSYKSVITGGVKVTSSMGVGSSAGLTFGDIELRNTDGTLDSWLDDLWVNKSIQIYIGDVTWPKSKFVKVFDGVVAGIDSKARDRLNLKLRDKMERLNNPVTETKLGGTTQNKDKVLPLVFGECHNVTPLLVDPALMKYMVHNGPIESLIEVRDNGVPINVIPDLATGQFTLMAAPVGTITASVQGNKPGGVYENTIAALIKRLMTSYGPVATRFLAAEIDTANFAAFAAANPQPVGIFLDSSANVLPTCQQLAQSVGAQLIVSPTGLMQLTRIELIAAKAVLSTFVITPADMYERRLTVSSRSTVVAADKVGFCKNWTVQDNLTSGIVEEHKALYAEQWLTHTETNPTIAVTYNLSVNTLDVQQRDTMLLRRVDAISEAQRNLALYQAQRTAHSFEGTPRMMQVVLGQAVVLQHPRFGLSAGKGGVVTSITPDWITNRVTVEVLV